MTPRQWWHNCDNESHSHQKTSDDPHEIVHLEKKDCFACDFNIGVIGQPETLTRYFLQKKYITYANDCVESVQLKEIKDCSHRGPPCI